MKVVYVAQSVAPYRVGGMQAVSRLHVEGLAARGWEVVLVHASGETRAGASAQASAGGPAIVEECIAWPARAGILGRLPGHYGRDLVAFSSMADVIVRREAPDVIYAEGPVLRATLQRPASARPPVVFHPHGLEPFQDLGRWRDNLRSRSLRPLVRSHALAADLVISQGGALTTILRGPLGVPEHRIRILPNAVGEVAATSGARGPHTPRRFIFVGREEPRKGLEVLLRAARERPEVQLDIVGSTGDGMRGGLPSGVRFHGVVREREEMRRLYDEADFLVLPSLAEGMPTVVLEAMARGLPVLATAVGAVPAVVRDGVDGWLVPRGSVSGLAAAMQLALRLPPAQYQEMSQSAIERIRTNFLESGVCDRLAFLLEELACRPDVEGQGPRAPGGAAPVVREGGGGAA